mgnify:CR=1 FL=1
MNKMRVKFIGFGGGFMEYPCYEDEKGKLYFDINDGRGGLSLHTGAYRDECDEIDGEPCNRITEEIECENPFVRSPRERDYMLLSRLQMDCEYYINHPGCNKNSLWSDIDTILNEMETILNSFTEDEKPEWLTDQQFTELKNKIKEVRG